MARILEDSVFAEKIQIFSIFQKFFMRLKNFGFVKAATLPLRPEVQQLEQEVTSAKLPAAIVAFTGPPWPRPWPNKMVAWACPHCTPIMWAPPSSLLTAYRPVSAATTTWTACCIAWRSPGLDPMMPKGLITSFLMKLLTWSPLILNILLMNRIWKEIKPIQNAFSKFLLVNLLL